jgi:hypothetical protein
MQLVSFSSNQRGHNLLGEFVESKRSLSRNILVKNDAFYIARVSELYASGLNKIEKRHLNQSFSFSPLVTITLGNNLALEQNSP